MNRVGDFALMVMVVTLGCSFVFDYEYVIYGSLRLAMFLGAMVAKRAQVPMGRLYASLMAFFEFDLKKILAYSTMSQIAIVMLMLLSGMYSLIMIHVMNHALVKALLFMNVGIVMSVSFVSVQVMVVPVLVMGWFLIMNFSMPCDPCFDVWVFSGVVNVDLYYEYLGSKIVGLKVFILSFVKGMHVSGVMSLVNLVGFNIVPFSLRWKSIGLKSLGFLRESSVPSDAFSPKDLIQQVLECGGHFFMDFANRHEPFFKVPCDVFSSKDLIQQGLECGVHFFMNFANGFEPFFKVPSDAFSPKDLIQQVLECGGHFFMDFANRHEPFFKVPCDAFSSKDLIQQGLECGVHFFMDFANGFEPFFKVPSDAFSPKDLIQQVLECGVHFFMDFANGFEPFFKVPSDGIRLGSAIFFTAVALKSRFRVLQSAVPTRHGPSVRIRRPCQSQPPFLCPRAALVSLKPMVHRVTTINGIEQSRQKSNLYRRKSAEAADFCVKITRPPTLAHSYGKTFEAREYA
ncbi:NADH-ubiquinone oxidoreductase chain 5 [Trichinella britovi]|uniref:NADH:ubiquinone reductase (H(+)-translocating) n=1 Tax=Trichinella britovi TaxID=45882 RepID=A0A0V1CBY4_TRIBR|nr:NADH-ubiquinone oxidoreductase chain 5 [Trichinella britovi]